MNLYAHPDVLRPVVAERHDELLRAARVARLARVERARRAVLRRERRAERARQREHRLHLVAPPPAFAD